MMFIERQDLANWLDDLAGESSIIAPRQVAGVTLYQPIQSEKEIAWDFTRPALSVKEAFFPTTERLFTIQKSGSEIKLVETLPKGEQVIFGVRPCDARGVLALDALFVKDEPPDPYYTQRRENTTLIGLACKQMGPTCFCTSVGGAPDDPSGVDLMLNEANGGFTVQVITERGQQLLDRGMPIIEQELDTDRPHEDYQPGIHNLQSINWPAHFDDRYWLDMSERCLSCRACAYVCPTCRCFDVRDERQPAESGNGGHERLRCWDSCARDAYRQIAGGHNPRTVKGERLRNRFFCKFHYYPQQYEAPVACTGCGRCIDVCPVNIDITEILSHLVEVSQ